MLQFPDLMFTLSKFDLAESLVQVPKGSDQLQ